MGIGTSKYNSFSGITVNSQPQQVIYCEQNQQNQNLQSILDKRIIESSQTSSISTLQLLTYSQTKQEKDISCSTSKLQCLRMNRCRSSSMIGNVFEDELSVMENKYKFDPITLKEKNILEPSDDQSVL